MFQWLGTVCGHQLEQSRNSDHKTVHKLTPLFLASTAANISQGVNYDPMNPMGEDGGESENKDAKAALRATSLVTK